MSRALVVAVAVLALAGCGAASHPTPKPKPTNNAASRSFLAGDKYGQGYGLPGEDAGEARANCMAAAVEQMPMGDVASSWVTGCVLGSLTTH